MRGGEGERGLSGSECSRGVGQRLGDSITSFTVDSALGSLSAITSAGAELSESRVSSNSNALRRLCGSAARLSGDSTSTGFSALDPIGVGRFEAWGRSGDVVRRLRGRRFDSELASGSGGGGGAGAEVEGGAGDDEGAPFGGGADAAAEGGSANDDDAPLGSGSDAAVEGSAANEENAPLGGGSAAAAEGGATNEETAPFGGGSAAAAAEGGAANEETAPFGGGSAAAAAEVGAANERSAPSENGLGEETPCAASSARLAALEAASAEAAATASADDLAVLNTSGGLVGSMPKTRGGTIDGRGVLDDAVPESGGVTSAASASGGAPAELELEGIGVVSAGRLGSCAVMKIRGISCSGRAENSRRIHSATARATWQERMWRRQSVVSSRRPELESVSAGVASRHSMIAKSYNARRTSGSFAKCARRRSRIELLPVFAMSRRNCSSSP